MTERRLTCADCDELFLDYFEGDLDDAARADVDAHVTSCARCQGLARDIAGIRTQAAALEDIAPSKDLWEGIEARIQPAVVSIAARRQTSGLPRRMLFAAAASLVIVTSSVTYLATSRVIGKTPRPARVVFNNPPAVPIPGENDEVGPSAAPLVDKSLPAVEPARSDTPAPTSPPKAVRSPRQPQAGTALVARSTAPMTATEVALSGEIGQLQVLLKQKRSQLDPATVQVVEDNLNLIDVAVKQARAALARDPASGFLNERLDNALQKKVELLRTAALLPSKS